MKRLIAVTVTAALLPLTVAAEGRDDESRGIRIGSFTAHPSLTVTEEYNSNIFRDENNTQDSFLTIGALRSRVESDWNRHGLRLESGLDYGYFASSTDDNYLDYFSNLTGVVDISRRVRITASVGHAREHDARGNDDVVGTEAEPVEFNDLSASLRGEVGFGRFRVDPFVRATYLDFDDVDALGGGPQLNNDDRDRLNGEVGFEVGYGVQRGYEAFVRTSYLWTDYDDALDDAGVDRDSSGFRVLGGVKVDLTRFITASAGVGFLSRNFEDSTL